MRIILKGKVDSDLQDYNMNLASLLREWTLEGLTNSDHVEERHFELNEIKIDPLHTHKYEEIQLPNYTKVYQFDDRCGNTIVAVYIDEVNEFKTGYKVKGVDSIVFQPEKIDQVEELIRPCPDDKKVSTVYKILTQEIVPNYLLNKRPNKLMFNPVSESRARLVDIILNKIIQANPELIKKNNYLIYK